LVSFSKPVFFAGPYTQIRKREVARLKSEKLASFDPLMKLHNRRSFYETIAPMMDDISNNRLLLCIIMLDADKFKSINGGFG
jgi:GGDEF domain-containing protein